MNLTWYVVTIAIGLLAVAVEAQENRSTREGAPNVIHINVAMTERSKPQSVLSLSELITQALENNPEIQAAWRFCSVCPRLCGATGPAPT